MQLEFPSRTSAATLSAKAAASNWDGAGRGQSGNCSPSHAFDAAPVGAGGVVDSLDDAAEVDGDADVEGDTEDDDDGGCPLVERELLPQPDVRTTATSDAASTTPRNISGLPSAYIGISDERAILPD